MPTVTADIIKRAAEESVAVYLDDFPGAAWDDGWFTSAYEIDAGSNGPCSGVEWDVYRDACKAAFAARRPVTGPDGDNPICDEQIRELRDAVRAEIETLIGLEHTCLDALDVGASPQKAAARAQCADACNARRANR